MLHWAVMRSRTARVIVSALLISAISSCFLARPREPVPFERQTLSGPPMPLPAPWHAGLKPCTPPSAESGAAWVAIGDIDADGRLDHLESVCDGVPGPHACAMRLCLGSTSGHVLAAAWTASTRERLVALPSSPPRSFEAYSVAQTPPCVRAHALEFGPGGYVSTHDRRCACRVPPTAEPPRGCERAN